MYKDCNKTPLFIKKAHLHKVPYIFREYTSSSSRAIRFPSSRSWHLAKATLSFSWRTKHETVEQLMLHRFFGGWHAGHEMFLLRKSIYAKSEENETLRYVWSVWRMVLQASSGSPHDDVVSTEMCARRTQSLSGPSTMVCNVH